MQSNLNLMLGVTMEEHAAKMLKYLREHPRRMYPFATSTPKAYLVKVRTDLWYCANLVFLE